MKAAIFVEPGRIVLDEKPMPEVGATDALIRITTTTSCGTEKWGRSWTLDAQGSAGLPSRCG
jgi:threonine dehydrogenase-like Zn-dependent dehydrogenase